ncbi:hypothetical protein C0J52_00026 [Blattella germanica]|nr:hypothetical protein C0J52_00026 [Blattella germanica]
MLQTCAAARLEAVAYEASLTHERKLCQHGGQSARTGAEGDGRRSAGSMEFPTGSSKWRICKYIARGPFGTRRPEILPDHLRSGVQRRIGRTSRFEQEIHRLGRPAAGVQQTDHSIHHRESETLLRCVAELSRDAMERQPPHVEHGKVLQVADGLGTAFPEFHHILHTTGGSADRPAHCRVNVLIFSPRRSRPEIRAASFSNRLNVERALLPMQHLKLMRQLLQDIRAELAPMTKRLESFHCRRALNQVTKVLEECYKTLTTLHGAKYVEKLDLLLEESVHGCDKNYFKKCLKEIPSSSKRVVALRKVCQSGNCQAVNGRSKYSNLFVNNKTCNRTIDFNKKLVLRRGKSVSFSRRKTDALKRQSSPIFGAWENKLYKEIKSNNFRTLRSKGRPLSASCLQIDKNIKNVLESTNKLVKNKDNATVVQITKARDDVQSKCQNDLNVYDKGEISAVCNGFCKTEGTSAELCPTENEESRTKDDDDMPSAYEEIDDGKARVSKQSFVSSYDIGCMTRKYVHTLARDIADLYESYKPMNENLKRNHNSISPSKFKRKMDIDRQSASPFDIRKLQTFNGSENTYEEVEPRDGLLTTYREVPLYQAYKYQNVRKSEDNIYIEPEEHVYEEIGDYLKTGTNDKPEEKAPAMEIGKPSGTSQRVRWADIPEVMESGLLDNLDSGELALQEAKYEIITSEASYFKSLAIVDAIFVSSPELAFTLSKEDYDDLFSDIKKVKQCSEKFLVALLDGWQDDIMLGYLCQAVSKFVDSGEFQVYVNTCENRLKIGKTLEYLKLMNSKFTRALSELEADPVCQNFTLQSFLTLPMQRVTRLPLLIQAILRRLPVESGEHQSWKNVLVRLQEVANECNEAIGKADKVTVEQCNQLNTKILTLNSKEKKKQQTIWNFLTLRR